MYGQTTIDLFKRASVAAISDAVDTVSRKKCFLSHSIRQLAGERVVGPAVTLMVAPTAERAPHGAGIELLDSASPGSVVVVQLEEETDAALWGAPEIAVAVRRGLAGFVGDGAIRSISQAKGHPFGIFATNVTPAGGFGRLKTMFSNAPIECGGLEVKPGDLIIGDEDGVLVLPEKMVAEVAALVERYERRRTKMISAGEEHASIKKAIDLHWNVES